MSTLMFYKDPIPLDKEKHKALKLKRANHYNFASDVNSVPVAGLEFFQCARNHPVMFVKNAKDQFVPIALLSLTAKGHNLGEQWKDVYVPSFVRRYPFVLEATRGVVMFDSEAGHLQEEEGEPLFDDAGEATDTLKEIIQFLETVDHGYKLTEEYVQALVGKELLEPFKGTIKFSDTSLKLDHLFVVDEKKFYESLSDEEIALWFKKGWMAWTHAHIHSIGAMPDLVKRLPRKEEAKA